MRAGICDLFDNEVIQYKPHHLTTEFYVPRLDMYTTYADMYTTYADMYTTYADMYTTYAMPYTYSRYALHISRHMRSFSFNSPQKAPALPH